MDIKNAKLTPWEFQSRTFADSLYKELDRMSILAESRNKKLSSRVNELLFNDGYPEDICVDILTTEGFDPSIARKHVEAASDKQISDSQSKYDYCFQDHRGRTFTGRELGNIVEASTDKDAEVIIKETLSSFDPPVTLLSINKVG